MTTRRIRQYKPSRNRVAAAAQAISVEAGETGDGNEVTARSHVAEAEIVGIVVAEKAPVGGIGAPAVAGTDDGRGSQTVCKPKPWQEQPVASINTVILWDAAVSAHKNITGCRIEV